jgi:dihydrofolate reductase
MMRTILAGLVSIDGKIGCNEGDSLEWIRPEDREWLAKVSTEARVVIMGRKAYEAMGNIAEGRLVKVMTRQPEKYKGVEGKVEFTNKEPKDLLVELYDRGFRTVIIGGGREIFSQFVALGLVGEIWASIVPVILGGGMGWISEGVAEMTKFKLMANEKLGKNGVVLKFKLEEPAV